MFNKFLLASLMLLAFSSQSQAVLLHGDIVFNGDNYVTTDTGILTTATTLTFDTDTKVGGASGAFASAVGSAVTFDIGTLDLDPTSPSGTSTFASFGNFNFTMESLSKDIISINGFDFMLLSGKGIFEDVTGAYEANAGAFNITLQAPGTPNKDGVTQFSFSSSATAVPEPASLLLLAIGLTGLGLARRKAR